MHKKYWSQDPCIMIVDTDADFRRRARAALEREGFQVIAAHKSLDALVMAADYPFGIDLLLADAGMRVHQNGLELAECFGILRPETRVLLTVESCDLSGNGLKLLADWDLLPKPLDMETLPLAAKRALDLAQSVSSQLA
jgi:DNA-binding NtrC family response regulator